MAGLELRAHDVMWKVSDVDRLPTESMSPSWRFLELIPFSLPSYDKSGYKKKGQSRR
jgi:hypothetical protein